MSFATDQTRRDESAMRSAIESAGGVILPSGQVKCPFHENTHTPAASLFEAPDGVWRLKCHNPTCGFQGDVYDVIARSEGKTLADVLPRNAQERPLIAPGLKIVPKAVYPTIEAAEASLRGVSARFSYTNPETKQVELVVFRLQNADSKSFRQLSTCPGGWHFEAPKGPMPIYNRARVRASPEIVVVEGEKCVHALTALGFIATTSPGGANAAAKADWSLLAGKAVWIWPDNDAPGFAYAKAVQGILEGLNPAPTIRVVDVESLDLPPKGDAADFIETLAEMGPEVQIANVQSVLDTAKGAGADAAVAEHIRAVIDGKKRAIPWPWPQLTRVTQALMPGTITVLHGPPSASKSFMLMEAFAYWFDNGVSIALYMLEDDRTYHLMRALAQRSGRSELTDLEWIRANPNLSISAQEQHKWFLAEFGRTIYDAPDVAPTYKAALAWVKDRAEAGCRIIGLDPFTALDAAGEKPWIADKMFINSAKAILRAHGASLILAHHPNKQRDGMAGGAGIERFVQTILSLEYEPERKEMKCVDSGGIFSTMANRRIKIEKARNGRMTGASIAFDFSSETLSFTELGVISKEKAGGRQNG